MRDPVKLRAALTAGAKRIFKPVTERTRKIETRRGRRRKEVVWRVGRVREIGLLPRVREERDGVDDR